MFDTAPPHTLTALDNSSSLGRDEPTKTSVGMSSGKLTKNRKSKRQESMAWRKNFIRRWSNFINSEFEGPAHTAFEFGCDYSTAEGWHDGLNGPSGPFVGLAYQRWPDRADAHLREQEHEKYKGTGSAR